MGIFIGKPGGMVVADCGMIGLAARISSTVVLNRAARASRRVAGLRRIIDQLAGLVAGAGCQRRRQRQCRSRDGCRRAWRQGAGRHNRDTAGHQDGCRTTRHIRRIEKTLWRFKAVMNFKSTFGRFTSDSNDPTTDEYTVCSSWVSVPMYSASPA